MIFVILLQQNHLIFQNLYPTKLNFCIIYFSKITKDISNLKYLKNNYQKLKKLSKYKLLLQIKTL